MQADLCVRWMSRSDEDSVSLIRKEHGSSGDLESMLCSPDFVFKVADSKGQVLGFTAYKVGKRKLRIVELAVFGKFRNTDAASSLLKSVSEKALESTKEVEMLVHEENLELQMFLKKCGFRATGCLNRKGSCHYRFSNA